MRALAPISALLDLLRDLLRGTAAGRSAPAPATASLGTASATAAASAGSAATVSLDAESSSPRPPSGPGRFVRPPDPERPAARPPVPAARPLRPAIPGERALGYVTVPTPAATHHAELSDQAKRIHAACRELDLSLVQLMPDVEASERPPVDRPGLARALRRLAAGEATCLVVADLRRVAPTDDDWQRLLTRIDGRRVRVVVTDVRLDTCAETGAWVGAGELGLLSR